MVFLRLMNVYIFVKNSLREELRRVNPVVNARVIFRSHRALHFSCPILYTIFPYKTHNTANHSLIFTKSNNPNDLEIATVGLNILTSAGSVPRHWHEFTTFFRKVTLIGDSEGQTSIELVQTGVKGCSIHIV